MTPEAIALARRRRLGITNIGFWVVAACGGLLFLGTSSPNAFDLWDGAAIGAAAVAAQAAFDFVGGRLLMPEPRPTTRAYLGFWLRGALVHSLILTGVGVLCYASFRLTGGFEVSILLATAGLAIGWRPLLHAVAGVATNAVSFDGGSRAASLKSERPISGHRAPG